MKADGGGRSEGTGDGCNTWKIFRTDKAIDRSISNEGNDKGSKVKKKWKKKAQQEGLWAVWIRRERKEAKILLTPPLFSVYVFDLSFSSSMYTNLSYLSYVALVLL